MSDFLSSLWGNVRSLDDDFTRWVSPTSVPANSGYNAEDLANARQSLLLRLGTGLISGSMPGLTPAQRAAAMGQTGEAMDSYNQILRGGMDRQYRQAQIESLRSKTENGRAMAAALMAEGGGGAAAQPAAPAPTAMPTVSNGDDDIDAATRTVLAEAANQGPEGLAAVAHVINTRSRLTGQPIGAVVRAPSQFEPWNTETGRARIASYRPDSPEYQGARRIVEGVLRGEVPDPTRGSTHFYAPQLQQQLGRPAPAWAQGEGVAIGGHRFYSRPDDFRAANPQPAGAPAAPAAAPAGSFRSIVGDMSPTERRMLASMAVADPEAAAKLIIEERLRRDNFRIATPQEARNMLGNAYDPNSAYKLNVRTGNIERLEGPSRFTDLSPEEVQRTQGLDPTKRYQRDQTGRIVEVGGTPNRFTDMTPEQVRATPGLDPRKTYQRDSAGRIYEVGNASTNVTVQNGTALSELGARRIQTAREAADAQTPVLNSLTGMQRLLDAGMPTGATEQATLGLRNIASSLGILTPEAAAQLNQQQLFQALSSHVIPRMRVAGSGASSDLDVQMFMRAAPNLAGSTDGQRVLVANMINTMRIEQRRIELMEEYYSRVGPDGRPQNNLVGFDAWARQEGRLPPLFPRVSSQEEALRHEPGTVVVLPNEVRDRLGPRTRATFPFYVVPERAQ